MAEQDPVHIDDFMGDVLGQLESSFAQLQTALVESNEKIAIYEKFDQTISQSIAEALEAAGNIRARAIKDAADAQELLRREAVQSLQEITSVREQIQQICQEMRQAQENQRLALQREREQREEELAGLRRQAEAEIAALRAQALEERKALLDEIAGLQGQRDVIYQQVETNLLGQLRTLKRSLTTEPPAQQLAPTELPPGPPQDTTRDSSSAESASERQAELPPPPEWFHETDVEEEEGRPRTRRRGIWRVLFGGRA